MVKKLIVLALFLLLTSGAGAKEISVSFKWDPNIEPDMAGYAMFQRVEGASYDYDSPIDPDCTIKDGKCYVDPDAETCTYTLTLNAPDEQSTKYYWVARARDTYNSWSGDSNEVSLIVDLTPLPCVTDFTGSYSMQDDLVTLSWKQLPAGRALYWKVYVTDTPGTGYVELLQVDNDGNDDVTTTVAIEGVEPGVSVTKYFVIVGFAEYDVHSHNSAEVPVVIDKNAAPADVINLRIPTSQ